VISEAQCRINFCQASEVVSAAALTRRSQAAGINVVISGNPVVEGVLKRTFGSKSDGLVLIVLEFLREIDSVEFVCGDSLTGRRRRDL